MKNFRVCNNDLNNWVEKKFIYANSVVDFLKRNNYFDYDFEIELESPLYPGEYATIVKCEDGFISFNKIFKIPNAFKDLIR